MRLHDLPLQLSRADFNEKFPGVIITPNNTAAMSEAITGGVIVYVLQFDTEKLTSLRLTVNEDFNEESYQNLSAVVQEIMKTMPDRGYAAPVKTSRQLAWKELIESPLPESGDRSIAAVSSEWNNGKSKASLTFSWTWPGQLLLEYGESQSV